MQSLKQQGIFKHLDLVPVLRTEQTQALTGLHQMGHLDIIQLCEIDQARLLCGQTPTVILNLSVDMTIIAMTQAINSSDGKIGVWQGNIIAINDAMTSPFDLLVKLSVSGKDVFGEVRLANDIYFVMPLGESLHAICRTRDLNAA